MKHLLWLLAVLALTASTATAGPNEGGVLWVHATGIEYTTDDMPAPTPPADCAGVVNQQAADGVPRVWVVYAAFPPGSSPRLKGVGFGTQFPESDDSPTSYVSVDAGGSGLPSTAGLDIPQGGFPTTSGGQNAVTFLLPQLTTVVELYHFAGFGYVAEGVTDYPIWCTIPHSAPANRLFVDDALPEANTDPITGYGCLGFGVAGTTHCPSSDPDAACCAPSGACTITKEAGCPLPSVWHRTLYVCTPNPCPLPTGACCYTDGHCQVATSSDCQMGGGLYMGDSAACVPSPCAPAAACCLTSGTCLVRTELACATLYVGAVWHSGVTSCTPNPCPPPPTGSCCFPNGSCLVDTQTNCTAGEWTLSGTCEPNICPAPNVQGACCTTQAACTLTLRADCAAPSQWHAELITCEPNQCPTPQGACCTLNGECTVTTEANCAPSSIWHSDILSCEPNLCPGLPVEQRSWGQIKNSFR
jgi:hypothetical protein